MNNIRQIIADKIAKLKDKRVNDYADGFNDGLIKAFKIFLEETPTPRTEQEILADFEKWCWKIYANNNEMLCLELEGYGLIQIDKIDKSYRITRNITMQEHKLLNELFEVWQWI